MNEMMAEKQKRVTRYYDYFSKVYDLVSSDSYYKEPRQFAIKEMCILEGQHLLNIPCGTGQNLAYFQEYLKNTGHIVGLDLSKGMLAQASKKTEKNKWSNITLHEADATQVDIEWINNHIPSVQIFDTVLCDLGLSGFPHWQKIIDNLLSLLKPNGKIVIMDWYIPKASLRGHFIKWIGKGEVDRPIYQYLEKKVENFSLNDSFKNGDMFVASGTKPVLPEV